MGLDCEEESGNYWVLLDRDALVGKDTWTICPFVFYLKKGGKESLSEVDRHTLLAHPERE